MNRSRAVDGRRGGLLSASDAILIFRTERFGVTRSSRDKVLRVPDGMLGAPAWRRFVLLDDAMTKSLRERTGKWFAWMQSVDFAKVCFAVTAARDWWPPVVVPESVSRLVLPDEGESLLMSIVVLDTDEGGQLLGDFQRPLVVDMKAMLGLHADLGEPAAKYRRIALEVAA